MNGIVSGMGLHGNVGLQKWEWIPNFSEWAKPAGKQMGRASRERNSPLGVRVLSQHPGSGETEAETPYCRFLCRIFKP